MAISLKHAFTSPVTDENNPDEVGPSEWNAEHVLTVASDRLLGRDTAGNGEPEEIAAVAPVGFNGSQGLWLRGTLAEFNSSLTDDDFVSLTGSETLTNKTLTSPVVETQVTLSQATANYMLTWADPAAARAITIPDPGGDDSFTFLAASQTFTNKSINLSGNTLTGTQAEFQTALSDGSFVYHSLFDANTILAADTDNAPTARTIAAQQVVARLTGGNIGGAPIGIADDNIVQIDGTPLATEYARFTANGLEGRNEAEFKADFHLEIGTDVQAWDADLDAIAALATTPFGRGFLTFADEAAFKAGVNLEANIDFYAPGGTDVAVADGGTGASTEGGARTNLDVYSTSETDDAVEVSGINAQTGTAHTLVLTDRGQTVTMDNAGANTVTIPTNASVAFDVGTVINIVQIGAGVTSITGDTGVTLNGVSAGSGAIQTQYQGVSLLKVATNTWIASGDIGAVA